MSCPVFSRLEPVDVFTLEDPRDQWKGLPPAEIRLGQAPDGAWFSAVTFNLSDRGGTQPLGWWSDQPRRCFETRADALASAVATLTHWTEQATGKPGASRIAAWLLQFSQPQQMDLFAA